MRGVPAVNADQTVILLWDQERQMQHFIRKATFRSAGESVGFLVPSPSRPELNESGNEAFPYLAEITTPRVQIKMSLPIGCSAKSAPLSRNCVRVIEETTVAGFKTVVLAADSGAALVEWLKNNGYAYTEEVAAWAQPYLDQKWYMTAMKIAKPNDAKQKSAVGASALRISFKTDRPLFPYRESDSRKDAAKLDVKDRTLRIFFVAEARYEGRFSTGQAWTGKLKWSRALANAQRKQLLKHLKLDQNTGPQKFWLSEFVDHWPYGVAPGDVYFSKASQQKEVGMNSSSGSIDPVFPAIIAIGLLCPWRRRNQER